MDSQRRQISTIKSGWLLRLSQPKTTTSVSKENHSWRRCWAWLTKDRLCYKYSPESSRSLKYISLDDIVVSAAGGPHIKCSKDGQDQPVGDAKNATVFMIECKTKSHFFAAETMHEAEEWISSIKQGWDNLMLASARSDRATTPELLAMREAHWQSKFAPTTKHNSSRHHTVSEERQGKIQAKFSEPAALTIGKLGSSSTEEEEGAFLRAPSIPQQPQPEPQAHGSTANPLATSLKQHPAVENLDYGKNTLQTLASKQNYAGKLTRQGSLKIAAVRFPPPPSSPPAACSSVWDTTTCSPDTTYVSRLSPALDNTVLQQNSQQTVYHNPLGQHYFADLHQQGGVMAADISQQQQHCNEMQPLIEYVVTTVTSPAPHADTYASVLIEIRGSKGSTGVVLLENDGSKFSRGACDEFVFVANDVGDDIQLAVMLEDKDSTNPTWLLEIVYISKQHTNANALTFPCHAWLRGGDAAPLVLCHQSNAAPLQNILKVHSHVLKHDYGYNSLPTTSVHGLSQCIIRIITSDMKGSGTDGNAYISLVIAAENKQEYGPFLLPNVASRRFQRNTTSWFLIDALPCIGKVQQIKLHHDGSTKKSSRQIGWRVDSVTVAISPYDEFDPSSSRPTSDLTTVFKCNCWVEPINVRSGAKEPELAGVAQPLNEPPSNYNIQFDVDEETTIGVQSNSLPSNIVNNNNNAGSVSSSTAGYTVAIYTYTGWNSGTKSRPFLELRGTSGTSGVLQCPTGDEDNMCFRPGQVDVFTFPSLRWLGDLKQLRIGTQKPRESSWLSWGRAWRLRAVEVVHLGTGRKWVFSANCWIDKSCRYVKTLKPVVGLQPAAVDTLGTKRGSFGSHHAERNKARGSKQQQQHGNSKNKSHWSGYP